jgi:hypothetical protein
MEPNYNAPQGELASQVQAARENSHEMSRREGRKSKKKRFFILLTILAFAGVGVFLIFKGLNSEEEFSITASPSPSVAGVATTPFPDATSEPDEEVDKSEVEIEVLNGTGISGEAGFLQSKLEALGYDDISAGNASSSDNETTIVNFSTSLDSTLVSEITKLLEDTYSEVETKTSGSLSVDVQITTGLRKGATPKPSASASASATATPTPTPTATP